VFVGAYGCEGKPQHLAESLAVKTQCVIAGSLCIAPYLPFLSYDYTTAVDRPVRNAGQDAETLTFGCRAGNPICMDPALTITLPCK